MKRFDCLKLLSELITDELVMIGMTGTDWEWSYLLPEHPGNMKICSLGNPTAVGLGMALALPHRRVIVLESDGSTLFDLASLTTIGTYRPGNLTVFVFDNEVYSGSRISQPSATAFNTDLAAMARGGGIDCATTVRDLGTFQALAEGAVRGDQLGYLVVKVEEDVSARKLPKTTRDYREHMYRFIRYIESTEKRPIFNTMVTMEPRGRGGGARPASRA